MDTRPISPHLSIYKPQITSVLSILHRITGIGLFCMILSAIWFMVILENVDQCMCTTLPILVQIFAISMIICLSYHVSAGIRYLTWMFKCGMEIKQVTMSGYIVLASTFFLAFISILLFYK